jgi:hypothetical protein
MLRLERHASKSGENPGDDPPQPSKFVLSFCDYLLTKTLHTTLETFIIEGFKTCKESERHQCADLMMNIAILCPEKTPIFAKICKDFGEVFSSLESMSEHFNKQLADKMSEELSSFKPGKEFDEEVKKYGKVFEQQVKYDIEDIDCIKLWLQKIFINSKLKSELAVKFLRNKVLPDDENFQKLQEKLLKSFPWLRQVMRQNPKSLSEDNSGSDEEHEDNAALNTKREREFGTIFKSVPGPSVLHGSIKKYIEAKKKGENVIFDCKRMITTSKWHQKNYAKEILNEALKNNASVCVLFLKEVIWTGWSLGNFLQIMLDDQFKMVKDISKKKPAAIDWDFEGRFGNFLCDLYIVEITRLLTMNTFLNAILMKFEISGQETAVKTFLNAFEKICEVMKRRDLTRFEVFIRKLQEISIKPGLSVETTTRVQQLLRMDQTQRSWRVSEASSNSVDIPSMIQRVTAGEIILETLSSEDLRELASCCVGEVVGNPNSKGRILGVILEFNLLHNSFKSSAHKIFRRELIESLTEQFDGSGSSDTDDSDDEGDEHLTVENIAVSEFAADLYNRRVLHKHALQTIVKKIKNPENYKTLFSLMMNKVERDFKFDKFDETNVFLLEKVEAFRAKMKAIAIEEEDCVAARIQERTRRQATVARSEPANCVPSTSAEASGRIQQEAVKTGAIPKR